MTDNTRTVIGKIIVLLEPWRDLYVEPKHYVLTPQVNNLKGKKMEQQIEGLTKAINRACDIWERQGVNVPKAAAGVKNAPASLTGAAAPVTYAQLQENFLALVKEKGRDAALAAIAPLPALKAVASGEQHAGQYATLLMKLVAARQQSAPQPEQSPAESLV